MTLNNTETSSLLLGLIAIRESGNDGSRDLTRIDPLDDLTLTFKHILVTSDTNYKSIDTRYQNTSPKEICGTYVHPILFNDAGMWVSAKYKLKVHQLLIAWNIHKGTAEHLQRQIEIEERERKADIRHQETIKVLETQLADAHLKHEESKLQYEDLKAQAAENRKELVAKYNDLVKRSNEHRKESRDCQTELQNQLISTQTEYKILQQSTKAITDQLITMNIKNDKLRNMVVEVHSKVLSLPINIIKPVTRTFDVVVKPPKKALQPFLILTVIRLLSPVIQNKYVVNRIQWRNHKTAVEASVAKALSQYENPKYETYYAYFESSASAITVWNSIKSQYDISGCTLNVTDQEFYNLINQLRQIIVRPEDEVRILTEEYERLKLSTDEQDKAFLAELEADESSL
jgi:hypothetical protein